MAKKKINRPKVTLEVHCGMVRKAQLREALKATVYEYDKTIRHLCETEADFAKAYAKYIYRWSLPEQLALRFVGHVCPGWEVVLV